MQKRLLPQSAAVPAVMLGASLWAGCTSSSSSAPSLECEQAAEKIAMCTGIATTAEGCDAPRASAVLSADCATIEDAAGKADCGFFTPWECWNFGWGGGGQGGGSDDGTLVVSVEQCLGDFLGDGCTAVSGVSCGRVVLEDASGRTVADMYTNNHGNARFTGLVEGDEYVVKVLRRDGTVAENQFGDISYTFGPSEIPVTFEDGARVDFNLRSGEGNKVYACATVAVQMDVKDVNGAAVDPQEIEWDWVATIDSGSEVEYHRSYRRQGDSASSFVVHNVRPGTYPVTYHRVSVPDEPHCRWYYIGDELRFGGTGSFYRDECRLPNRNHLLLENFEVDATEPQTFEFTVTETMIGQSESHVETPIFPVIDPVPGE